MTDWLHIPKLRMADGNRLAKINAILQPLHITDSQIERIGSIFCTEMDDALHERPASLQMENTYIPELPDGTEEGTYLALDLGGTNFRAILLELKKGQIVREIVKPYHISDEMRLGPGRDLFDFLAACLTEFVNELGLADVALPLGFTFSFPMKQHSLDSGELVTWTKSFCCSDCVDKDVVRLLRDALNRCGHNHIEVLAILNDTTGTLVQGARMDADTRIGIVLGTGSNACYVEQAERVQHWESERHGERNVIIDIEWGAFGDNGSLDFIRTEFDNQLDATSLLVKSFTFEKYIGGKYLGELVRCVLERLVRAKLILKNHPDDVFPQAWALNSDQISKIECDNVVGTTDCTIAVLNQLGYDTIADQVDIDDLAVLKHVAALIGFRAAKLVAINTAQLLKRISKDNNNQSKTSESVTIAIDGSVYKHHPRLKAWLEVLITKWAPGHKFKLMLAEDGSGKGAGLAAAIALRLKKRQY